MSEQKNTQEQKNAQEQNTFQILNNINVNPYIKKKLGLSYLSWAHAWGILKTTYPDAEMTVYGRKVTNTTERTTTDNGETVKTTTTTTDEIPYFTDGRTTYVKVGVTIEGREYVEMLPVMDNHNNAVLLSAVTMTAVNRAIQRAFVKACARHGLGLYVYAGEDLPENERKVINFEEIANNCDRYAVVTLNDEGFAKMKDEVIKMVQENYPEDVSKAIVDYTSKQTQGKRLSLFTIEEDSQRLQRIYAFVNEVKKQLAAPDGK